MTEYLLTFSGDGEYVNQYTLLATDHKDVLDQIKKELKSYYGAGYRWLEVSNTSDPLDFNEYRITRTGRCIYQDIA